MAQATLNGQVVDDGGLPCSVRFEWGSTTAYGQITRWQGGLTTGMTFSATIFGLGEGVLYHFRAVAQNARGIFYGQDMSFSTLVAEGIPVMIDDGVLLRLLEVL